MMDNSAGRLSEREKRSIVVHANLERPIDEIDALASLLLMARKVDQAQRHGYDLDFLDEIVLRRIRALARRCQDDLVDFTRGGPAELREPDEDEAPHC